MNEKELITKTAELNAKFASLTVRMLELAEPHPEKSFTTEEMNIDFLQRWLDDALKYEFYNCASFFKKQIELKS